MQELEIKKELEFLERRKQELQEKQAYNTDEKEAWKDYELKEKGFTVLITKILGGRFHVKTEYNKEFVSKTYKIYSRDWNGTETSFDLKQWNRFNEVLTELTFNTTLTYSNGTEEQITEFKNRPFVTVSVDKGNLILQTVEEGYYIASRISGVIFSPRHSKDGMRAFKISLGEVWRVFAELEGKENIVWTEEAKEAALESVKKREELDRLLGEDVTDIDCGVELEDITLRPFQKQAIAFTEATNYNCIIAHQMGLGKTPISVADCVRYKATVNPNARFLFVIPSKLKANWAREILRFTNERAHVLFKAMPDKLDLEALLVTKHTWNIINYEIIGRKTEIVKDGMKVDKYVWADLINLAQFDIIILDEAHYIKNVDSQRSRACRSLESPHFLPMTGTPILNRPGELWPLLYMINKTEFPSFDNFKSTYVSYDGSAKNVESLRSTLKTLMIRKTKKEVLKDLPPINRIYEFHDLTDNAKENYKKTLEGIYTIISAWNPHQAGSERDVPGILAQIMRLKQICAMDKINTVSDLAVEISDSDDNGGKVIVFSQFVPVVEQIARRLGHEAIVLHGSKKGQDRIDEFRDNPTKKFLVAQYQVGGEGHNLQCANNVVFADLFWTPASHQQCEERAYGRLADPHPINSYYVVIQDTIETWIRDLLAAKLRMIESVVEGIAADATKSIAKELMLRMKKELGR